MDKISVIIPTRNEEKYIAGCLESVIRNDYSKDYLEVLVMDGKSTDSTQIIVKEFSKKYNYISLLINENKTVPYAMNSGIKKAAGDYIIRLDAHGEFPSNYFSKLIKWSKKLNADNVGALWVTDVKNKTPKTLSIKSVLSNKFGVGNSYFRIGTEEVKEVDTVPFGCYKKDVFQRIGLFDYRLERDQDIELNKRLKRNGGRIFLVPDVYSIYYARETYSSIAKNNFQTGLWNILTVYFTRRIDSLSLRHFIPFGFLLSLIVPFLLMFWNQFFGYLSLLSLILYIVTFITISLQIKNKTNSFFHIVWSFLVLHFSYGFGSLVGLFRFDILLKKKDENRNI
jgi:glycosyltransferase involved in cell wall biosynthesis